MVEETDFTAEQLEFLGNRVSSQFFKAVLTEELGIDTRGVDGFHQLNREYQTDAQNICRELLY